MVQIIWTELAKEELKKTYAYISSDSSLYAKRTIVRIRSRVKMLRRGIYLGKVNIEYDDPMIRELIEGNYRIIYKVYSSNKIAVLSIHHSSRDLYHRSIK